MSLDSHLDERPLPLVALVGCAQWHGALTSRAHGEDELHARYLSLPMDTRALDYTAGSHKTSQNILCARQTPLFLPLSSSPAPASTSHPPARLSYAPLSPQERGLAHKARSRRSGSRGRLVCVGC